ncbi:hypothetical protein HYDPIDRAFT_171076 [Hydnomerulius pinastri MD-312]|uniref:Uncharacterized protein n=1 Tax=Hydnomerulius pinastri MD-312 TaxID=994086 RepID=A0A0C9V0T3_9AGAM|nr:hypothetical protein HYDPIDRAFT_171076 [Hydnomerulius pinastri MD-312]
MQLSFYPPKWKDFLEECKIETYTYAAIHDPWPCRKLALLGFITDAIIMTITNHNTQIGNLRPKEFGRHVLNGALSLGLTTDQVGPHVQRDSMFWDVEGNSNMDNNLDVVASDDEFGTKGWGAIQYWTILDSPISMDRLWNYDSTMTALHTWDLTMNTMALSGAVQCCIGTLTLLMVAEVLMM